MKHKLAFFILISFVVITLSMDSVYAQGSEKILVSLTNVSSSGSKQLFNFHSVQ